MRDQSKLGTTEISNLGASSDSPLKIKFNEVNKHQPLNKGGQALLEITKLSTGLTTSDTLAKINRDQVACESFKINWNHPEQ